MMAETSYGTPDRWTTTSVGNINDRIAQGVFAVHFNYRPNSDKLSTIDRYRSQLNSTCIEVGAHKRHSEILPVQGIVRSGNLLRAAVSSGNIRVIAITGQRLMLRRGSGQGEPDVSTLAPGVYIARNDRTLLRFVR